MDIKSLLATPAAAAATVALAAALAAGPARADNQFTLDRHPDSFAAVVTDKAGNGYIAWEHSGGVGADTPTFCRIAPEAKRCSYEVKLGLPDAGMGSAADANQLFPILGPGSVVWVVSSRYVLDDTLVWTSTDGGRTFSAPYDIPYVPLCTTPGCMLSYPYSGLTDIDDALPVTPGYATYDGQRYLTSSGSPSVYWLESSFNPGLGFNLNDTAETS